MTTMRALFPVRCLIPIDAPRYDALRADAVVTWPDGVRQRVGVLNEDVTTQEARVRYWVRVGCRAEAVEQFVPMCWLLATEISRLRARKSAK